MDGFHVLPDVHIHQLLQREFLVWLYGAPDSFTEDVPMSEFERRASQGLTVMGSRVDAPH